MGIAGLVRIGRAATETLLHLFCRRVTRHTYPCDADHNRWALATKTKQQNEALPAAGSDDAAPVRDAADSLARQPISLQSSSGC